MKMNKNMTNMREIMRMTRKMGLENIDGQMVQNIKVISKMISRKARGQ